MVDLKEFLEDEIEYLELSPEEELIPFEIVENRKGIDIEKLGLFFWERGGKQFVNSWFEKCVNDNIMELINDAESLVKTGLRNHALLAQDFLDCVACLGEDKVKELIKKLEEGVVE